MRIKSKTASLIWKALIVVVGLVGLVIGTGVFKGAFNPLIFGMFTTISNAIVVVYFFVALVVLGGRTSASPTFCPLFKQIVTMGITVTFLVAHFFLSNLLYTDDVLNVDMLILHYIVPIMTILDWLLFDEKGRMRAWAPFLWTILPLAYLAVVEVAINAWGFSFSGGVEGASDYPYPFLDAATLGWPRVIGLICALVAAFIVLGYVWRAIDGVLARAGRK